MAESIFILEDETSRIDAMCRCLERDMDLDRVRFFNQADLMIDALDNDLWDAAIIGLDHDLELIEQPDGLCLDSGTGRQVADYLATQKPVCPVVIHSTNSNAVLGMLQVLNESCWMTARVIPEPGLDWIQAYWYPEFRKNMLRQQPNSSAET